jgi:myo-inositol-1(or 4)-monophosphatase
MTSASAIAMHHFDRRIDVELKADGSPATEADRKINAFLEGALRDLLPDAAWLSEENLDTAERLGAEWIWIVDPLDGTREFIRAIGEFGISVGLVHRDRIVASAVSNPATGEYGVMVEGSAPEFRDCPPRHKVERLNLAEAVVSRSESVRGEIEPYISLFASVRPLGSVAYKLLRVASGAEDLTFSVQPKHEWDICGGVGLIQAAGLDYIRFDGTENRFNGRPDR